MSLNSVTDQMSQPPSAVACLLAEGLPIRLVGMDMICLSVNPFEPRTAIVDCISMLDLVPMHGGKLFKADWKTT
jgi:hypothetical protein